MELEHTFSVPVPIAQAWEVLLDVERIAPCMPGATVDSFDGETILSPEIVRSHGSPGILRCRQPRS